MNLFSVADSSKGWLLLRVNGDTVAGKKLSAKVRHLLFCVRVIRSILLRTLSWFKV